MTPQEVLQHSDTGDLWPTSGDCECNELSSAYETALAVRALRVARGELPVGYKIGFTNRTIWSRYNVFAPIWGSMWNTTIAHCNGAGAVSLARLCQPRIEPEVVFGIKATPRANSSLEDLFEALEWAAPGFEIVQSHALNWKFTAAQTVVDGGLHGRLLIGQRVPIADLACDAGQLHQVLAGARVRLHKNGELVEEGAGVNVLDSPLRALMHFLVELRSCPGATDLVAGDVVTTGTWTDAWPVTTGKSWTAVFSSALPPLQVSFE